jgi:hypothetical protein
MPLTYDTLTMAALNALGGGLSGFGGGADWTIQTAVFANLGQTLSGADVTTWAAPTGFGTASLAGSATRPTRLASGAVRTVCVTGVSNSNLTRSAALLATDQIIVLGVIHAAEDGYSVPPPAWYMAFNFAGGFGFWLRRDEINIMTEAGENTPVSISGIDTDQHVAVGLYLNRENNTYRYASFGALHGLAEQEGSLPAAAPWAGTVTEIIGNDNTGRTGTTDHYGWMLLTGVGGGITAAHLRGLMARMITWSFPLNRKLPT